MQRPDVRISAGFYIYLSAIVLLYPLKWIACWYAAAIVHELCHAAVILLFRKRIFRVEMGVRGIRMHTEPLANREELMCSLAGPAGSFLLFLFARAYPLVAFCGLIQFLFNMLPLYPLDGGRVIRCLFCALRARS